MITSQKTEFATTTKKKKLGGVERLWGQMSILANVSASATVSHKKQTSDETLNSEHTYR